MRFGAGARLREPHKHAFLPSPSAMSAPSREIFPGLIVGRVGESSGTVARTTHLLPARFRIQSITYQDVNCFEVCNVDNCRRNLANLKTSTDCPPIIIRIPKKTS